MAFAIESKQLSHTIDFGMNKKSAMMTNRWLILGVFDLIQSIVHTSLKKVNLNN